MGLREIRDKKKITRRQIASATNLTESTIKHAEVDPGNVKFGNAKKIADFLGISVADLLEE